LLTAKAQITQRFFIYRRDAEGVFVVVGAALAANNAEYDDPVLFHLQR